MNVVVFAMVIFDKTSSLFRVHLSISINYPRHPPSIIRAIHRVISYAKSVSVCIRIQEQMYQRRMKIHIYVFTFHALTGAGNRYII